MHKYIPRLHIVQSVNSSNNDTKLSMLSLDNVNIFVFPETQFIAVTAYQNEQVFIYLFILIYVVYFVFSCSKTFHIYILGYSIKN